MRTNATTPDRETTDALEEEIAGTGTPGHNPRNQAVPAEPHAEVPEVPDPRARHEQDAKPVNGDVLLDPPDEANLVQKPRIQG